VLQAEQVRRVVVAYGPQPVLSERQPFQGVELVQVGVAGVGEVGAEQDAICTGTGKPSAAWSKPCAESAPSRKPMSVPTAGWSKIGHSSGEGATVRIAIPLFDRFTALDAVGPYEVLKFLPHLEIR
jgi:hypothetical protein